MIQILLLFLKHFGILGVLSNGLFFWFGLGFDDFVFLLFF